MACSALARRYRDRIRAAAPGALFVELTVDPDELDRRMRARDHFMPPALLGSQIATLEHLGPDEQGFAQPCVGRVLEISALVRDRLRSLASPDAAAGSPAEVLQENPT